MPILFGYVFTQIMKLYATCMWAALVASAAAADPAAIVADVSVDRATAVPAALATSALSSARKRDAAVAFGRAAAAAELLVELQQPREGVDTPLPPSPPPSTTTSPSRSPPPLFPPTPPPPPPQPTLLPSSPPNGRWQRFDDATVAFSLNNLAYIAGQMRRLPSDLELVDEWLPLYKDARSQLGHRDEWRVSIEYALIRSGYVEGEPACLRSCTASLLQQMWDVPSPYDGFTLGALALTKSDPLAGRSDILRFNCFGMGGWTRDGFDPDQQQALYLAYLRTPGAKLDHADLLVVSLMHGVNVLVHEVDVDNFGNGPPCFRCLEGCIDQWPAALVDSEYAPPADFRVELMPRVVVGRTLNGCFFAMMRNPDEPSAMFASLAMPSAVLGAEPAAHLPPPTRSAYETVALRQGLSRSQFKADRASLLSGDDDAAFRESHDPGDYAVFMRARQLRKRAFAQDESGVARQAPFTKRQFTARRNLAMLTQRHPFGGSRGVPRLLTLSNDSRSNCDGFKLKITSMRKISHFFALLGNLCVVTLVGTSSSKTVWVDDVEYVLLASSPWSLWVEVSRKHALNERIGEFYGVLRESHALRSCMSTGGNLTMTLPDLEEILRNADVRNLYAVVHSVKSGSSLFLDCVDSLLSPRQAVDGEWCAIVADVALAFETGLKADLVLPAVGGVIGGGSPGAKEGTIMLVKAPLPQDCNGSVVRYQLLPMFAVNAQRLTDFVLWQTRVGAVGESLAGYLRAHMRLNGCPGLVELVIYSKMMHTLLQTAQRVKNTDTPATTAQLEGRLRAVTCCMERLTDPLRQEFLSGVRTELWLRGLTSLYRSEAVDSALALFEKIGSGAHGLFVEVRLSPSRVAHDLAALCERASKVGLYNTIPGTRTPTQRALQIFAAVSNAVGLHTWWVTKQLRAMEIRLLYALATNCKYFSNRADRVEALASALRAADKRNEHDLRARLAEDEAARMANITSLAAFVDGGPALLANGMAAAAARRSEWDNQAADTLETAGEQGPHNDAPYEPARISRPKGRAWMKRVRDLAGEGPEDKPPRQTRARTLASLPPSEIVSPLPLVRIPAPARTSVLRTPVVDQLEDMVGLAKDLYRNLHMVPVKTEYRFEFRAFNAFDSKLCFSAPTVHLLFNKLLEALDALASQTGSLPGRPAWRTLFQEREHPRTDEEVLKLDVVEQHYQVFFESRRRLLCPTPSGTIQ